MTTELPFVSVLTPTYNRRRFLANAIACYVSQDYPKNRMEWVILDDGSDAVGDVFEAASATIPNIRYVRSAERTLIGAKRNELHRLARGEILVSWDDDDFYPPERVSHAVEKMQLVPDIQVAGSSTIYIYFSDVKLIHRLGPFAQRHATNGTMAVRREFALTHFYDETVSHGEEESFLNYFTFPMIQLSPLKVMLVMSHNSNTFDKGQLRDNPRAMSARTELGLHHFIKDEKVRAAFEKTASEYAVPTGSENTMAELAELSRIAKAKKAAKDASAATESPPLDSAGRLQKLRTLRSPSIVIHHNAQSYTPGVVSAILDLYPTALVNGQHNSANPPDIVISHVTEIDGIPTDPASFLIVISGEAWTQRRRADIAIAPSRSANAAKLIFYPHYHASLGERRVPFPTTTPTFDERRDHCAFMYGAACAHRNKMFEELRATPGGSVLFQSLGAQCNPNPRPSTRNVYSATETYNDIAVTTYLTFRFVLAIENAWVDGYFTEKVINPMAAGAVPVYWGHPSVFEYINKKRVIYIPDYKSMAELASALATMTAAEWAAIVAQPWYTARGEPYAVQRELETDITKLLVGSEASPSEASPSEASPSGTHQASIAANLQDIPPLYYINLERRSDRRSHMERMLSDAGVTNATRITATDGQRAASSITAPPSGLSWSETACLVSHLRAIREWLETSESQTAIICEDDLSFETVPRWGCGWGAIAAALGGKKMPGGTDWDVVQLAVIYTPGRPTTVSLHERIPEDWSACAYLIQRPYAERLIATYWDATARRWSFPQSAVRQTSENVILLAGRCLSIPLFTYTKADSDIQTREHVELFHTRSRDLVLAAWQRYDAKTLLQVDPAILM